MRVTAALLFLGFLPGLCGCAHTNIEAKTFVAPHQAEPAGQPAKVDFSQLKPILQKCQPCHFSGGKVYAKLPFDREETIRSLGTKLFTRIQDESERKIVREFLSQQ